MSALKIPAVQSLFAVKTRSLKVDPFKMDDGEKYGRDDGTPGIELAPARWG